MVYKVRNKTFDIFNAANTVRAFPAKKTQVAFDVEAHVTLQVHITRFTGMRILHNYRNISRACKQFMMGDRFLEQLMILQRRQHYFRPMTYNAPIENTFFMGRSLADLSDRHYSLFANNQHPIQLATYQNYNEFLRMLHDRSEADLDLALHDRLKEVVEARQATLDAKNGESLSIDELTEMNI